MIQYTGLDLQRVRALPYREYLSLRRDAFIYTLNQTEAGQEYLDGAWRWTQTEPDRKALRAAFGRKE